MEQPRRLHEILPDSESARIEAAKTVEGGLVLLELQNACECLDRGLVVMCAEGNLTEHQQRPYGLLLAYRLIVVMLVVTMVVPVAAPVVMRVVTMVMMLLLRVVSRVVASLVNGSHRNPPHLSLAVRFHHYATSCCGGKRTLPFSTDCC